jgi:hypothetical protein
MNLERLVGLPGPDHDYLVSNCNLIIDKQKLRWIK